MIRIRITFVRVIVLISWLYFNNSNVTVVTSETEKVFYSVNEKKKIMEFLILFINVLLLFVLSLFSFGYSVFCLAFAMMFSVQLWLWCFYLPFAMLFLPRFVYVVLCLDLKAIRFSVELWLWCVLHIFCYDVFCLALSM